MNASEDGEVTTVMLSLDSLICVAFHLLLQTVASVHVVGGPTEDRRFFQSVFVDSCRKGLEGVHQIRRIQLDSKAPRPHVMAFPSTADTAIVKKL